MDAYTVALRLNVRNDGVVFYFVFNAWNDETFEKAVPRGVKEFDLFIDMPQRIEGIQFALVLKLKRLWAVVYCLNAKISLPSTDNFTQNSRFIMDPLSSKV